MIDQRADTGMALDDQHVPSPCVRCCTLDDADICLGCFRSLDEIKDWSGLDSPGRRTVLARSSLRRAAAKTPPQNWMRLKPRG